jgi:hypothetical protein
VILAKIIYNGNTFIPAYPPKGKVPVDKQDATRHDSITTSGLRQSITERVDRIVTLDFPFVPESDVTNWDAFVSWAIVGGQFQYYPDSTLSSNNTYQVVDTQLGPEFVSPGFYKFSMNLRRVVTAQIGS